MRMLFGMAIPPWSCTTSVDCDIAALSGHSLTTPVMNVSGVALACDHTAIEVQYCTTLPRFRTPEGYTELSVLRAYSRRFTHEPDGGCIHFRSRKLK
ncbi:hypothetical protein BC628DRAFT_1398450 [Trametes gibbosa]|nr:hypothetical protein BC628DRAFT_1398450 [Trametes gibbosa]